MFIHVVSNLNAWPDKQLTGKIQVAKKIRRCALSRRPLCSVPYTGTGEIFSIEISIFSLTTFTCFACSRHFIQD